MNYKEALRYEMHKLNAMPNTIFMGQQVFPEDFYGTLTDIASEKRIEMPVAEELQAGMAIGMALRGMLPISIYQRIDFLPRAADQIVNHLDLIARLSFYQHNPKVIIRTTLGSLHPLDVGLQHNKDLSEGFRKLLHFPVINVETAEEVHKAYKMAREIDSPIMIIEDQNLYEV